MTNTVHQDEDLNAFLEGRDPLSHQLKSLSQLEVQPSAELDAVILKAIESSLAIEARVKAQEEHFVQSKTSIASSFLGFLNSRFNRLWYLPVGMAAGVLLSFTYKFYFNAEEMGRKENTQFAMASKEAIEMPREKSDMSSPTIVSSDKNLAESEAPKLQQADAYTMKSKISEAANKSEISAIAELKNKTQTVEIQSQPNKQILAESAAPVVTVSLIPAPPAPVSNIQAEKKMVNLGVGAQSARVALDSSSNESTNISTNDTRKTAEMQESKASNSSDLGTQQSSENLNLQYRAAVAPQEHSQQLKALRPTAPVSIPPPIEITGSSIRRLDASNASPESRQLAFIELKLQEEQYAIALKAWDTFLKENPQYPVPKPLLEKIKKAQNAQNAKTIQDKE